MTRWLGALARVVGWMALGAVVAAFAVYLALARSMPDLGPWHEAWAEGEAPAGDEPDFAQYLADEDAIFRRLEEGVAALPQAERGGAFHRYTAGSRTDPFSAPINWNRTFEWSPDDARGAVLLLHGLSDSPYSLRSIAELFRDRGFSVLGLRLPGHGTTPGSLSATGADAWRAAVRAAARHAASRAGASGRLVIVGYSMGALLAVDYTLEALAGSGDPPPAALVLLSPAMQVSAVAAAARFQRRLAGLPGLSKLAWTNINVEYDPCKYVSFPVRAGEEIYGLTREVDRTMRALGANGRLAAFPPVLAFQSVVDATIVPSGIVDRLFDRLPAPAGSSLVMFDVNRLEASAVFMRLAPDAFPHALVAATTQPYDLTLVTNRDPATREVVARRRAPGGAAWDTIELGLAWPSGVYSMSHVALPFPEDDPIYGVGADPTGRALDLGALVLRGERQLFAIPMDELMRLRYNPFHAYLASRLEAFVDGVK